MRIYAAIVILLISFVGAFGCEAACATQVTVYDRANKQELPLYRHEGRWYVAGEPGHEYEIRIRNSTSQRALAVTTVDGVNVITGETGSLTQSGYVLDAYGATRIEGWRKSLSHTAAFYFTSLGDSYAARTGRPDQVGVIGVALFREREPLHVSSPIAQSESSDKTQNAPSAAAAPSNKRSATASDAESKLGTGHGRSEYSAASYTQFEKASTVPEEIIAIYYDSQRNLVAQGIIPQPHRYAERLPQPFPNRFTPDP